jgi:cobalamin transport system substrate-binding protein
VPFALFAVGLLLAAGAAIAGTAAYFELRPTPAAGDVHLTDDAGRSVAVPSNPARVVSLAPSITDSLVRLGLRSHIVGVDCYAAALGGIGGDYTDAQIAAWNLSSSLCIQTGPSLSIEEVINATPDLVLVSTIVSQSDVEEMSQTYRLPVVVLQPATIGGIVVDLELLGQIFPGSARLSGLVASLQGELARAAELQANLSANATPFPTVLLTYWADSSGYYTYGPGSFGASLISVVSAASISAGAVVPYPQLSGGQVLNADPWAVLYATGFGVNESTYAQGPDWGQLSAVTNGRAWGVDSTLLTEPGPTMILSGLPTLLALLHPAGG